MTDLDPREKAIAALYEHAQVAWHWSGDEYDDVKEAVDVVLAASAPSPRDRGWTPTSDGPEPIEYECELCGGSLDGPYEKCGSAQHGPNGTVIYGRAVPVSPIPDSEFTGNPWRDAGTGEARPVMPNISAAGPSVYKPDKRPAPPVPEGQDEASKSNPDEQEVDGA